MEGLFTSDEARSKRCLALLENHSGPINCVRWNMVGTMFASADDEGTIILWEYRGHTVITAFQEQMYGISDSSKNTLEEAKAAFSEK